MISAREIGKLPGELGRSAIVSRNEVTEKDAIRIEIVQSAVSAGASAQSAAQAHEKTGVNVLIVQAEQNGCRIARDGSEAAADALERDGISMIHGCGFPHVGGGETIFIEQVLSAK